MSTTRTPAKVVGRHVLQQVSNIRNARYEAVCSYLFGLLDGDEWRDYTVPAGTRYQFRSHEFDWFLAANELDVDLIRHAVAKHAGRDRWLQLADITGRGVETTAEQRRENEEIAAAYPTEVWAQRRPAGAVTDNIAKIAADPARRRRFVGGGVTQDKALGNKRWWLTWTSEVDLAERLVARIIEDPDLERAVYRALHTRVVRDHRAEQKRRSAGTNGKTAAHSAASSR